ncbi:MAG: hypothetical protein PHV55_04260 [Candidatus Omnitrophica bacterium]|nr:hypothetical protein [Candidatus Omnitrophota bacterium]
MFDNAYYQEYRRKKEEEWEALCKRCGGCCGIFEDPCKHLKKDDNGKYFCEIYNDRFGVRESVGGKKFKCVHISQILNRNWFNDRTCAYKINLKMPWLKSLK